MRVRGYWFVVVVVSAVAVVGGACTVPPTGPAQGQPGSSGPCGSQDTVTPNPAEWWHPVHVVQPTGSGRPRTGGTCDDGARPVVLLAHGYTGSILEGYRGLLDHLTSHGFVVIFPGYRNEFGPPRQYEAVRRGLEVGLVASGRADPSRLGVVGHSFGGGMVPWLLQQVHGMGLGGDGLWAAVFAPHFSFEVGGGPVEVPAHTHLAMVSFAEDYFVDARIGIEAYGSLVVPGGTALHEAGWSRHLMVHSDYSRNPPLVADHIRPVSITLLPGIGSFGVDHLDVWAVRRVVDVVAECAMSARWCDTDLSDMGTWPDGRAVRPATVRHDQVDVGPAALQECSFVLNPRPCPR